MLWPCKIRKTYRKLIFGQMIRILKLRGMIFREFCIEPDNWIYVDPYPTSIAFEIGIFKTQITVQLLFLTVLLSVLLSHYDLSNRKSLTFIRTTKILLCVIERVDPKDYLYARNYLKTSCLSSCRYIKKWQYNKAYWTTKKLLHQLLTHVGCFSFLLYS